MLLGFKHLRIVTAFLLVSIPVFEFGINLYSQSQAMLDGPFARSFQYTFALNKIVLAILLSTILLFDFKFTLPSWGQVALKIMGIAALSISIIGLGFLIKHSLFFKSLNKQLFFYVVQCAYILISLIIISKGFEENSDA